ncbi:MAG: hypothetical protein OEZ39_14650 [Gammaproteobacteria bacterium]|nr:hypothetical protein [Gammaproteobacteria bacterium]MDH5653093.1 hypothetical protein [Gammaproteobacteria bacterium]
MAQVIEQFTVHTPLGIRLWDPVTDRQIRGDMHVVAYPAHSPHARSNAYSTRGGVYTFRHLKGMRGIEYGYTTGDEVSPAEKHDFIVEISDKLARYLSVSLRIELPLSYRGVFLSDTAAGSPHEIPKGLYLYSAPTRSVPGWMAIIRGELVNQETGDAAAHALLRVMTVDGEEWYGVSDAEGRYTIMLPYPDLPAGFSGSPLSPGHKPLADQFWDMDLEVFYSPATQVSLPGTIIPSYLSILSQDAATIWPIAADDGGMAVASLPIVLEYNKSTNPRTDGFTTLLVSPAVSSP